MRKLLLACVAGFLFYSCEKQNSPEFSTLTSKDDLKNGANANSGKMTVCHYDSKTGKSKSISIDASAWKTHESHGDLIGDCSQVITNICGKDWAVKNLDVSTYRNGDPILNLTDDDDWSVTTTGAWSYYNNDPVLGATYGKLYNLFAVLDPRGLAPVGWHIPSYQEWLDLQSCLQATYTPENVGGAMKEVGTLHWLTPNGGATNITRFTGLPGGTRHYSGSFGTLGESGDWWSSHELENINDGSFQANLWYYTGHFVIGFYNSGKAGLSVRLIRD